MKKLIILLIVLLLSATSVLSQTTDWDKLKLVDEIFLQMEYVNDLRRASRNYRGDPRRENPYSDAISRNVRILEIDLKFYEKRYQEDFSKNWRYEDWLKEHPFY